MPRQLHATGYFAGMRYALAALILAAVPAMAASVPGEDSQDAWWIIAGSAPEGADTATMNAFRAVRRCGLDASIGSSSDFLGLTKGLTVVFLGPFVARNGMENTLEVVQRCVPDAYPKWTTNWKRD